MTRDRTARFVETALGAALVLAAGAALPLGLRASAGGRDLRVTLQSAAPHEIARRSQLKLSTPVVGPPELLPRLELTGAPDREAPGLALRTWQVTYGQRWERQVTLPVLY